MAKMKPNENKISDEEFKKIEAELNAHRQQIINKFKTPIKRKGTTTAFIF